MTRRTILIGVLFIILLAPVFLAQANAAPITIVVNNSRVSANINLMLTENVTTSLPSIETQLGQADLTVVAAAIKSIAPTAHIDLLTMHANSTLADAATGLWILDANYTITVSGVVKNTGGRMIADLSFLSVKILDSITTSDGSELNTVGSAYLVDGIGRFTTDDKTRYFMGSGEYTQPVIPLTTTTRFSLLDLSWIPPVSKWTGDYEPLESAATWSFTPRGSPYNLTIGLGLTPEGTFVKKYVAYLNPTLEIIAPARAQAQGSTIVYEVPSAAEIIMPIIITISILAAVSSFTLDWKLSRKARQSGRRKR